MAKLSELFDIMEEIAPASLAQEWDRVGLQIGNSSDEATGIMTALDPSPEAVEETAARGLNLLITHHPLFFSNIHRIDLNSSLGRVAKSAIKASVTIFTAHTNLDSVRGGMNDILAGLLSLKETGPMERINAAGDGSGRIGLLEKAVAVKEIGGILKDKLATDTVRIIGDLERGVTKIALCSGSGGSLIGAASQLGAELFISGDIRYHQAREAEALGLTVIDAGHFSSEKIGMDGLRHTLKVRLEEKGIALPVMDFKKEREPFTTL